MLVAQEQGGRGTLRARWGLDGDFTLGRSSYARAAWDAVLAAAVCYEAATPLELSFLESGAGALALGRRAATAVFAGDILVNLRTGFYAGEREVRDGRAIAWRYLRSRWFLLDFVTVFPFNLVLARVGAGHRNLLLLRLLRVARGGKLFHVAEEHVHATAFLRMVQIGVFLCLNLHWSACAFRGLMSTAFARSRGLEAPDLNACAALGGGCGEPCAAPLRRADPLACAQCCDAPGVAWALVAPGPLYLRCAYVAFSFLMGFGAEDPLSDAETAFATALAVYGCGLQASVVGAIAVALQGLETEETHQRAKLSEVSRRMAQMHLPRDLRRRVCEYYRHVWHLDRGSLLGDGRGAPAGGAGAAPKGGGFLGDLSPALRNEVKMHLFAEMLRANPLFQSPRVQACAGLVEAVVERLFTTVYLPGDTILRKGETSPWMGFIGTGGRVAVVLPPADETQQPKTLKILHEGDIIGELGLIFSARRSTDVRALVCVRVHVLSRDAFNAIKAQYPAEGDLLETEIANSLVKRGRMSEADVLKLTKKRTKRRSRREARRRRPPLVRVTPLLPVSPELEAEIAEEEKAIEHLVRSNAELEAHLKDAPDRELRAAVGENIVVIARKRAALQLKYDLRAKLEASAPIARSEARPPPPPAAASTEARAPPDGGVYL
ncbi:voltage-gated potassium channel [Aureococcus anophagefferens]|nr:voltage-gated potassium channel [Aureococcus anophagefferens]